MDQLSGQLLLALTCVAVAAAVLVRRFVLMIKSPGKSGCHSGGCGGCAVSGFPKKDPAPPLVELHVDDTRD